MLRIPPAWYDSTKDPTKRGTTMATKTVGQLAREWAIQNGIDVPAKGRVKTSIIEQYLQATGQTQDTETTGVATEDGKQEHSDGYEPQSVTVVEEGNWSGV